MSDDIKQEVDTSEIEKIKQEAEFYKAEAKKAFEKRDQLKKELEEREQKALEEQNKYKELYESLNPKLKEFEEKLAKTEQEKEEYLSKLKSVEDSTKQELMAELSDEHKAIASKLSLEDLREYVKINRKQTVKTDKIKTVGEIKKPFEPNSIWKEELSKIGKY